MDMKGVIVLFHLITWTSFCTQGSIFSYNRSTRQLHFQCPETRLNGDIKYIEFSFLRPNVDWANRTNLAFWIANGNKSESSSSRIKLVESSSYYLKTVMDDVTCSDSAMYICFTVTASGTDFEQTNQSEVFTLYADPCPLSASVYPNKLYPGHQINFSCSGFIGHPENVIIWETRMKGGTFESIKNVEISNQIRQVPSMCSVNMTSSLLYRVLDDDDNREWRCKMRWSNHSEVFIAKKGCRDNENSFQIYIDPLKGMDAIPNIDAENKKANEMLSSNDGIRPDNNANGQNVQHGNVLEKNTVTTTQQCLLPAQQQLEGKEKSGDSNVAFTVVAVVVPVVMFVMMLVLITWRRHQFKQMSPLLVLDSPAGTVYNYAVCPPSSRPPSPVDLAISSSLSAPELPPPYNPSNCSDCQSNSIYVSMSALNFALEFDAMARDEKECEEGMRIERSESIYSNKAAFSKMAASAPKPMSSSQPDTVTAFDATYKKVMMA